MSRDSISPGRSDIRSASWHVAVAWFCLILVPLFFFLGFAAAHVPYAIWGFEEGAGNEPLWFDLLTGVILFGILAIPLATALTFGYRSVREGSRWGWVPTVIAGLLSLAIIVWVLANIAISVLGIDTTT